MKSNILTIGLCKCIYEPRGDNGLEGFQRGDIYVFERRNNPDRKTKDFTYYKVFPAGRVYGECCGRNVFFRYFTTIKEVSNDI